MSIDGRTMFRGALLIGLSALAVSPKATAAPSGIPASARAELLKLARTVATNESDPHPYDIEAVRTTRLKAARVLGLLVPIEPSCEHAPSCADAPWYVVAMRGHFSCNTCSHPPRAASGAGKVITLWREAKEPLSAGQGSGFGFAVPYPNLCKVGTPFRLDGPRAPQDLRCPKRRGRAAIARV